MLQTSSYIAAFAVQAGRLRHAAELSVADLAEHSGLAAEVIERIEAGQENPGLAQLRRLASGLGVSLSALFPAHDLLTGPELSDFDRARLVGNIVRVLGVLATDDDQTAVLAPGVGLTLPHPNAITVWPDVMVVREAPQAASSPTVRNPALVVAVEPVARQLSVAELEAVDSLIEYLLVGSTSVCVEHHQRIDDGAWRCSTHGPGELVQLRALAGELAVDELYRGVSVGSPA